MNGYCGYCGKPLDQNGYCGCQSGYAQNAQPQQQYDAQQYNGQQYNGQQYNGQQYNGQQYNGQQYAQQGYGVQKRGFMSGVFKYIGQLIKYPSSAVANCEVSVGEAILIGAVLPIVMFIFSLSSGGQFPIALTGSVAINFLTLVLGSALLYYMLYLFSLVYGGNLFKGYKQKTKTFSLWILACLPLAAGFLAGTLFAFFSYDIALIFIIAGAVLTVSYGVNIFVSTFNLPQDKSIYACMLTIATAFTDVVILVAIMRLLGIGSMMGGYMGGLGSLGSMFF